MDEVPGAATGPARIWADQTGCEGGGGEGPDGHNT